MGTLLFAPDRFVLVTSPDPSASQIIHMMESNTWDDFWILLLAFMLSVIQGKLATGGSNKEGGIHIIGCLFMPCGREFRIT